MLSFLMFIYIVVCFGLILAVLLQSSKGGGLAGAFGGGGGDMGAVFGGRGAANFLSKLTTILATAFMVLALIISFVSKSGSDGGGLVQQEQSKRATTAPASPASGLPIVPTGGDANNLPIQTGESATQADSAQ